MTYEEALKIAKSLKPGADACDEYDTAFVFKTKSEEWALGGDGPCVILKRNGNAIGQTEFYDRYGGTLIRSFDIGG